MRFSRGGLLQVEDIGSWIPATVPAGEPQRSVYSTF